MDRVIPLVHSIRERAVPLREPKDLEPLIDRIAKARVVMLGEATHGTHEFYRERARITRRLVEERGFGVVAVEADWPDAYRVNRWIRLSGSDDTAIRALDDFRRFPRWMWRNRDVLALVEWLREHNQTVPSGNRVTVGGSVHAASATSSEPARTAWIIRALIRAAHGRASQP
jgi:erythromycin esterase-like protein